jgi:hypothetical protein
VFDRVEMNVIDESLQIRVVTNLVLPEATLPNTLFLVLPTCSLNAWMQAQARSRMPV